MKIFADLHHGDLYYSLQLLFEKRLGAELYRPIGLEWYSEGYWHIFPHIDTARQFLATDQATRPPNLNNFLSPDQKPQDWGETYLLNKNYTIEDGIYYVLDPTKNKYQRGVTLEKFKSMNFDIIISSIPQHIGPFNKLIQLYQPQAKHIFQVGNAWGHQPGVRNILASTAPFSVPSGINACFYHQEFDLGEFRYEPPTNHDTVCSYIHFMQNKQLMTDYATNLPGWTFRSYGAGMEDTIALTSDIAKRMRNSAFTWHYKPGGDGYGHVLANTYASGRPAIVWQPFYQGKLMDKMFEDGVTCIDISKRSVADNVALLQRYSQPEEHVRLCEAAYRKFKDAVNFDEDERRVRSFLERLF